MAHERELVSDLLGNIVSKAFNLAPLVEPRLLSRFEPWQPAGALGVTQLDPTADFDAPSTVSTEAASTESTPANRGRDAADVPRRTIEHVRPDPIDARRPPAASERLERNVVERIDPNRSLRDFTMRPAVMPPAIAGEKPHSAEPPPTIIDRIERLIVDHPDRLQAETRNANDERINQLEPIMPNADPKRARPAPAIETVGQPQTDRVSGASKTLVQSIVMPPSHDPAAADRPRSPRPAPFVERVPIVSATEREPRSAAAPTPPPAPPTIHVSIGRVEVRATMPAAPVKRSPASTSAISLDEYLRRRAGDRR
jgi:hypothetical protein